MQKNTYPRGCLFGSILDNNTIRGKRLKNTLKNTEKYRKILKNTDLQGCPFGSMLDSNTNTEKYLTNTENAEKY